MFNCSVAFRNCWRNMSRCWGLLQPSGLAAREHKTLSPFWPFVKSVAPVTLLVFTGSCTYMWLKIAYHWLKWCRGWHYQLQQLKIAHSFWSQVVFLVYFSSFPSPYHLKFSSKEITPPSLQSCLWLLGSFCLCSLLLPSHFTNLLLVSSLQFPSHSALCLFWSYYSVLFHGVYLLMCISICMSLRKFV